MPAGPALIAPMAEKRRSIAGRATRHLLDALGSDTGRQERTLDTAPEVEMRVLHLRRIVRGLGTEERTEPIGEIARDLVTATADRGPDGGEDGLGIGSRDV